GRRSMVQPTQVNPAGPHQCIRRSDSVNALNTSSRGASKMRLITRPSSAALLSVIRLPLVAHLVQVAVQAVEALAPAAAIGPHPVCDVLERRRLQPAGPPLRLAPLGDQPGPLQHLEVLGDSRQA